MPAGSGKCLVKSAMMMLMEVVFILNLSAFSSAASAEPIPSKPDFISYVYDYAGLIDDSDEARMKAVARIIDMKTGAQIVAVAVNDLNGMSLEDYSLKLFRQWGIGDREKNNGILLLVNKENLLSGMSGRIRIEVGYGLEGAINDAKAGRILDDFALPAFEKKQYSEGIADAYMAIAGEVAREYGLDISEGELSMLENYKIKEDDGLSLDIIIGIIVFIIILSFMIPRRSRRKYHGGPFDGPFFGPFGGGGFGGGSGFGGGGGFGGGSGGGGGASR
jgi:uncharacterized protein